MDDDVTLKSSRWQMEYLAESGMVTISGDVVAGQVQVYFGLDDYHVLCVWIEVIEFTLLVFKDWKRGGE